MPASVSDVLVVGVGDPVTGSFLNGRNSRQDISTLRQIATRLRGTYHNGNDRHLPSDLIKRLTLSAEGDESLSWGLREWALLVLLISALGLSLLPILLHYSGTRWQPGIRIRERGFRVPMDNPRTRQQNVGSSIRMS
jgi:Ca-activated chloride channel family protein